MPAAAPAGEEVRLVTDLAAWKADDARELFEESHGTLPPLPPA